MSPSITRIFYTYVNYLSVYLTVCLLDAGIILLKTNLLGEFTIKINLASERRRQSCSSGDL